MRFKLLARTRAAEIHCRRLHTAAHPQLPLVESKRRAEGLQALLARARDGERPHDVGAACGLLAPQVADANVNVVRLACDVVDALLAPEVRAGGAQSRK